MSSYVPISSGRSYEESDDGTRSKVKCFRVELDDPTQEGDAAVQEVGLLRGQIDGGLVLLNIQADPSSKDGRQWIVKASYGIPDEGETNPLNEPPDIKFDYAPFTKLICTDIFNRPLLNSAGDPIPNVEIDDSKPVLRIALNQSSFNYQLSIFYKDAINSTVFFGMPPKTVKVAYIGTTPTYHKDVGWYNRNEYVFTFEPLGYDRIFLDQGFRQRVQTDAGFVMENITFRGKDITSPALLNGQGLVLPIGGQPQFQRRQVYATLPFNVFGF